MGKWTEREIAELNRLKAAGLNNAQIGAVLGGRTRHAIGVKINKLAKGQVVRVVKPWSPQEIEAMLNWRDNYQMSWDEIGRRLSRPSGTVYCKYKYAKDFVSTNHHESKPSIPASTFSEWRQRQGVSHHNLTALLCGDPLPGYSALERRT